MRYRDRGNAGGNSSDSDKDREGMFTMVRRTNIAYADFSGGDLNPILGCTPASTECDNCYARALIARFGSDPDQVRVSPDKLERLVTADFSDNGVPFRRGPGSRPLAFVCDMSDLFHPDVPDAIIKRAFQVFRYRQDVDWLVLTKRPERMLELAQNGQQGIKPWPSNVWAGTTVGHPTSLWRIGALSDVPAPIRWVSAEPLLAPLDIMPHLRFHQFHWLACGGESGPNRRPFDVAWARDIRDQCVQAGVPFFYKQGSGLRPGTDPAIDGVTYHEFPCREVI